MRERSDEDLMLAWAGGSMAAFETLYGRYRVPLYRYLLRMCGDPAQANDLYQGSWEKVVNARRKYRRGAPFKPWLFRVAHNHAVDQFRRQRQHTGLEPDVLESAEPDPSATAEQQQRHESLARAVRELPREQRDALLLRLEGGLDVTQIAQVTGCGRETAKSRLRYAVKRLRQKLQEQVTDTK